MKGYDPLAWNDFSVALAGAAAALTGLLFVAVSVNVQRILSYANLPARAVQTLVMLIVPLIVSVVLLIPGQSRGALGAELIVIGLLAGAALGRLVWPAGRSAQQARVAWLVSRLVPSVLVAALLVVAGATLAGGAGGGLYWVAPAVLVALLAGLSNAWVLLVEILR